MPASSIQDDFILEAKGLHVHFPVGRSLPWERKQYVHAVDGVSLGVRKGETLAVVGESGSGKTTLCRALVGLIKPSGGNVLYNGEDLQQFVKGETIKLQGKVQMVFQDPDSSLNPFMKVGEIVAEPISRTELAKSEIGDRAVQTLELVGLGREIVDRRAVELSGGQKQRVSIARAIISNPDVVTLDEPSSALDVAVQSQILNLLVDLQKLYGLGYILVTHNISVAQFLSDRIAVMYAGKIQELGATRTVMSQPLHPYTMTLIEATPLPDPKVRNLLRINVKGEPPSALNPPSGCRFHPRCPFVQKRCETEEPTLRGIMPDHFAACHFAEDVQKKLKPG